MPQYSIQPTSILQEYQTTQTDPEHLQGRELCVFGIIAEHEFIERRKDKKISLGEFIFLVLRKNILIFS